MDAVTKRKMEAMEVAWDDLKRHLEGQPAPNDEVDPDTRRWWGLLKAVEQAGGSLSVSEWRDLGVTHGYDPRGLGGFFSGKDPTMRAEGDRRVITAAGRRWVDFWASRM